MWRVKIGRQFPSGATLARVAICRGWDGHGLEGGPGRGQECTFSASARSPLEYKFATLSPPTATPTPTPTLGGGGKREEERARKHV